MDRITIGDENDGCLTFDLPTRDAKGWVTTYRVGIRAPGLSAALHVDDNPAWHPPTQLFAAMAEQWRGWTGELKWHAIEGEYDLAAKTDTSGHIRLRVTLSRWADWSATISLRTEAGILDRLHQQVSAFFTRDT